MIRAWRDNALRVLALALLSAGEGLAHAEPILHEPISPDPAEDVEMHAILDGNLPAALWTSAGPVDAPDLRHKPTGTEVHYGLVTNNEFRADLDVRATTGAYDDPFIPTTAPFKRWTAFDAVAPDGRLVILDANATEVVANSAPRTDDDAFYMSVLVDLVPSQRTRIPSVGPGARVVAGRLAVGPQALSYAVTRDSAENWYVEGLGLRSRTSARLVLEIAIARAALGGPIADSSWSELPPVVRLPANIAAEALQVSTAIRVSRRMRPREALGRLVEYFRSFSESRSLLAPRRSAYLDLALSQAGVCRHRAYGFMITALALGIPTRFIENEIHAWVEIHDGTMWRRIDLGGAGRFENEPEAPQAAPTYIPPPDSFPWPSGSQRSEVASAGAPGSPSSRNTRVGSGAPDSTAGPATSAAAESVDTNRESITRPASAISLVVDDQVAQRGAPLRAHGQVQANGTPCVGVRVDMLLHDRQSQALTLLGRVATDTSGTFDGSLLVPASVALGEYDIVATTPGNARCGPGRN